MKLIVGMLFVMAAAWAMPLQDEDRCLNHASPEVCMALLPMDLDSMMDEEMMELDHLQDEDEAEQMKPAALTADDLLEKLIWEKLKIFAWLVGVVHQGAGQYVRQFIEQNRDEVTKALKEGGLMLIQTLMKIVSGAVTLG